MIEYIINELQTNQILVGLIGGGLFGSLLYSLRKTPSVIWDFYNKRFVWSARINDDNTFFQPTHLFFGRFLEGKTRRLKMAFNEEKEVKGTPSYGIHWRFYRGCLITVNVDTEESQMSKERKETLSFKVFGPNNKLVFSEIIDQIVSYYYENLDKHSLYFWDWGWFRAKELPNKDFESVFLKEEIKNSITEDLENFRNNKEFYKKHSLPYKRGYIFYGPPGTGKTSMIYALANKYGYNLCFLDLNEIDSERDLRRVFTNLPKNSILAMEDVDAFKNANERALAKPSPAKTEVPESGDGGVSMSSILQMLDGMLVVEGTIVVATTNHIEKLDPAFKREGRFDLKVEFQEADEKIAKKMLDFYDCEHKVLENIQYPVSQAYLQNRLIVNNQKQKNENRRESV